MKPVDNEKGGMTVFALLALTALLAVSAILSDVVRVRAADAEGESAGRRYGRSMLAGYDPKHLAYGLFGADLSKTRVEAVAEAMIEARGRAGGGRLAPVALFEEAEWEPLYPLGDHRVYQRQILERMKYMAGLTFGIEITQKLGQGRAKIVEARQFAELSKQMETELRKREEALDQAWSLAQRVIGVALSGSTSMPLQSSVNDTVAKVEAAEAANEELRKLLNAPIPGIPTHKPETPVPHVTVYPSTYFGEYKTGIGAIASFHSAWQAASAAEKAAKTEEEAEAAAAARAERNEQLHRYVGDWRSKKSAEEAKRQQEWGRIRSQQIDQKKAAEQELNKRRDNWKDACEISNLNDYAELTGEGGLFEKYRSYNEHTAAGGMDESIQSGDPEAALFQALHLVKAISDLAEAARDEVFTNEYALSHFTYRTYQKQQLALKVQTRIGDQGAHRLQEQEAEYILYGLPGCMLNLSAAHTELFVLRTGLRTMEALMKPKAAAAAASPMTVLLAALAEGAKAANQDVDALAAGEDVELPFVPGATMNYKDHLRLFFLIHSRNSSMLSRMQALTELNTGIDLMKQYTAVRVRLPTEVRTLTLAVKRRMSETVASY
ncbi:hypothetical protein MO973_19465 [Paenibacillus sp. TRM 82003]|nr:hypothetical protein [Paenibacillus sp. TRM 82003]